MKKITLLGGVTCSLLLSASVFADSTECPANSGSYCQTPTAYCCGNEDTGYYCAKDVNGCTR